MENRLVVGLRKPTEQCQEQEEKKSAKQQKKTKYSKHYQLVHFFTFNLSFRLAIKSLKT